MADETTYESEINQPSHRPGMEGVVNRGGTPAPDARDSSGNRISAERPTVHAGSTDPFSIKGDGPPKGTGTSYHAPAAAGTDPQSNQGISGIGGRTREAQIQDATDKAVTG